MYRRPKFLEVLLEIREEMSREADYDVDLFAEKARSAGASKGKKTFSLGETNGNGLRVKTKVTTKLKTDLKP